MALNLMSSIMVFDDLETHCRVSEPRTVLPNECVKEKCSGLPRVKSAFCPNRIVQADMHKLAFLGGPHFRSDSLE